MDEGFAPRRGDFRQPLGGAAGQPHRRRAARQIDDAHVAPEHAVAQAGAERLGAGLLGGEALGVGGGALGAAVALGLLDPGEAASDEAGAEPIQRLLDALDVAEVAADADDHARPSSIAARIRRMLSAKPTKIASPTRKCPMLSSTICGSAEISRAVS